MEPTPDDLTMWMSRLAAGEVCDDEAIYAINLLGKAGRREPEPVIEAYLSHGNAEVRCNALKILVRFFGRDDLLPEVTRTFEREPDPYCRMLAASLLSDMKQDTSDPTTLGILARVVANEDEDRYVRQEAYQAMLGVIHFDPRLFGRYSGRDIDFDREIDWELVRSYLAADGSNTAQ